MSQSNQPLVKSKANNKKKIKQNLASSNESLSITDSSSSLFNWRDFFDPNELKKAIN